MVQQPGDQLFGQLVIVVPAVRTIGLACPGPMPPAACVQLVDVHGAVVVFVAQLHPGAVVKCKVQLGQAAGCTGAQLGAESIGICPHHGLSVLAKDAIFIQFPLRQTGDKGAPYTGVLPLHLHAGTPAVKAAAYLDAHSARCPDPKQPPGLTIRAGVRMSAQITVGVKTLAGKKFTRDCWKIHVGYSFFILLSTRGQIGRFCWFCYKIYLKYGKT